MDHAVKDLPSKTCATCGRRFGWRKRWARNWPEIRYCSRACRGNGVRAIDRALEAAILELLEDRASRTICPSEAARRVRPGDWSALMEPVRQSARRLAAEGRVEVLQGGRCVATAAFRGPVRLRARMRGL